MKRLVLIAAAALALGACATATPYQAAGTGGQRGGYMEQRLETNRYRVGFAGNSLTSRDTVEMYLLYRSAELTLQDGYDWFSTVDRATDRDTRYVGTPEPWFGPRYGAGWGPSWRFYRGGAWSRWDPFWGSDFDVREVTRYEANAEIVMGRGPKPASDPNAFDARDVVQNLAPRVATPPR
jgi:hypothetical protein